MLSQSGKRGMLLLLSVFMLNLTGCANALTDALPYWPFGDNERTSYLTPAKRMDQMRAMAAQAGRQSASEHETIASSLAAQIKKEEDPLIREEIVRTLSAFPTATSRAVQVAALKDFDAGVRITAIKELTKSKDAEVPSLLAGLVQSDADIDVRLAATEALGSFPNANVLPTLAVALDDTDPALQHRAILSLKATSGQDYGNDISAWRQYARGETPTTRPSSSIAERILGLSPF